MFQSEYFSGHPHEVNPVQLNDVVFSLHATAACIVTALQCFIYEVCLLQFGLYYLERHDVTGTSQSVMMPVVS